MERNFEGGQKSYLDVWLVDFFSPSLETNTSDTTSLFILQLACIVNMVPRWKKLKVRVFIIKSRSHETKNSLKQKTLDEAKSKLDVKDASSSSGE